MLFRNAVFVAVVCGSLFFGLAPSAGDCSGRTWAHGTSSGRCYFFVYGMVLLGFIELEWTKAWAEGSHLSSA